MIGGGSMIDSIVRLPWRYEVVRLIAALKWVEERVGWSDNNQIALTCGAMELDLPFTWQMAHGDATKQSRVGDEILRRDEDYKWFIADFQRTYFRHIWNHMNEQVPGGVCRMRLMRLREKGCLSFHEDFHRRYHIPIITNDRAFFFMNESGQFPIPMDGIRVGALAAYHLPADGGVFEVDTTQHHTVYNGSRQDRIHLVFSAAETD